MCSYSYHTVSPPVQQVKQSQKVFVSADGQGEEEMECHDGAHDLTDRRHDECSSQVD